jgi:hypothetical protein
MLDKQCYGSHVLPEYYDFRLNVYDSYFIDNKKIKEISLYVNNYYVLSTKQGIEKFFNMFNNKKLSRYKEKLEEENFETLIEWLNEILLPVNIQRRIKLERILDKLNPEKTGNK